MKPQAVIRLNDLFSITETQSYLHAYCRKGVNCFPFETYNQNLVWNKDSSVDTLLRSDAPASTEHCCCAVDTTREATTADIISAMGGIDTVKHHLYAYQSIEQLVSHCPSYRRCFGDTRTVKEEMNLFFTLGNNGILCTVAVSFGPFPKHQYSVSVYSAIPSEKVIEKKTFSQKLFSFIDKTIPEKKWPKGTRVFLIGEPKEVFEAENSNFIGNDIVSKPLLLQ